MCSHAPYIPDECLLDIGLIAHTQRDKLSSRTEHLKEYVLDPKYTYICSIFYDDEVILFKNDIYIPILHRDRNLNWYHL